MKAAQVRMAKYAIPLQQSLVFVLVLALVPQLWCGRQAADSYQGKNLISLANAVQQQTRQPQQAIQTGSSLYNAEWELVTCQMTVLGLGQVLETHPEKKAAYLPAMQACLEWLTQPAALAFGAERWGQSRQPLARLTPAAYLGYLNMALGMYRHWVPESKFTGMHERLSTQLIKRLQTQKLYQLQTYPHETYPADIATVVGSIGLYDRVTGQNHQALIQKVCKEFSTWAVDPRSGLLYQALNDQTGQPEDQPRASGTAFAVYFLAFADPAFSRLLYQAVQKQQSNWLGFGGIREYPPGSPGQGDIDSGPVLLGIGTSATGFALAGARIHQDFGLFQRLYRTAYLFGAPRHQPGKQTAHQSYLLGGPLGNAMMLALLSARPGAAPG